VVGDEVELDGGYRARVERLDGLRIARVRLTPPRAVSTPTPTVAFKHGAEVDQPHN
jgi:hypothetical protein